MLSSDKNVENIAELIRLLKHYLGLQGEYLRLDVIDKVVRLLTATALAIVFFLFVIAVALMLSLSAAFWLGQHIGMAPAFLVMAVLHIIVFVLFFVFRKPWVERPLVRFLASLFMSK